MAEHAQRNITARDLELWRMPSIQQQMPVVFSKDARWDEYDGHCASCGERIPAQDLRGIVRHPLATVAEIEAVGVCHGCRLVTRFLHRLHEDMRVTGLTRGGWGEWHPCPSWTTRLRAGIRAVLVAALRDLFRR